MTCAQGLLRLLWGGPKLECYGTDCMENGTNTGKFPNCISYILRSGDTEINFALLFWSIDLILNMVTFCNRHWRSQTKQTFIRSIQQVLESISKLWEGAKVTDMYFQD